MNETVISLLTFIVGVFGGVHHAKIKEIAKNLSEVKKKVEVEPKKSFVSLPSYFPPHATKQTGQVVSPKTPEQLNREAQEKLRQQMLTKQP